MITDFSSISASERFRSLPATGRQTTLVIAHRLSTIVDADQIVVVHAGSVVEQGTHSALLDASGKYAALWRAQLQEHR